MTPDRSAEAVTVARDHFSEWLSTRESDDDLSAYMKEISNYDVSVSRAPKYHVIVFSPRTTAVYADIEGGGGEYWIDATSLAVVSFQPHK